MPDFPLKSILGADLCSSCGVCVGICPVNCLAMKETGTDLFWKMYRRLTCRDRFFEKCLDVCIGPKKLAARILRRFLKRSA